MPIATVNVNCIERKFIPLYFMFLFAPTFPVKTILRQKLPVTGPLPSSEIIKLGKSLAGPLPVLTASRISTRSRKKVWCPGSCSISSSPLPPELLRPSRVLGVYKHGQVYETTGKSPWWSVAESPDKLYCIWVTRTRDLLGGLL